MSFKLSSCIEETMVWILYRRVEVVLNTSYFYIRIFKLVPTRRTVGIHLKAALLFVVFMCCYFINAVGQNEQTEKEEHLPTVFDTPVTFSGWQGKIRNIKDVKEIRIGYFAPDDHDNPAAIQMVHAAELAIEEANRLDDFKEVPIKLVRRWASDPWGKASKEMIKLIYQDSVWAIIGSINGESTHIAEQIVTKARVPLLTPVSTDPTLTYIRIPWMFRLPPDDKVQAEAILKHGIQELSLKNVGLITSTDHDGRIFSQAMRTQLQTERLSTQFHLQIPPANFDAELLIKKINTFGPDGIIMRLPLKESLTLLKAFDDNELRIPLFIPWIPGFNSMVIKVCTQVSIYFVQPFSIVENTKYDDFAHHFQMRYGMTPGTSASFTYDAVQIVTLAIQSCGLNRAKLRDTIFQMNNFRGVSGRIDWNSVGGNKIEPVLNTLEMNER